MPLMVVLVEQAQQEKWHTPKRYRKWQQQIIVRNIFFHNIYGEAQTLIDTIAVGDVAIPAGWSGAAETNREDYVSSINTINENGGLTSITTSGYPTVFYYRDAFTETITATDSGESGIPTGTYGLDRIAGWYEFCIEQQLDVSDWTWTKVNEKIQWLIDNNKTVLP